MRLRNIFDTSASPDSLGHRFRARRTAFFRQKIAPLPRPLRILDIGGLEFVWLNAGFQHDPSLEITLLNLERQPTTAPNIRSRAGDGTQLRDLADHAYDLVFSNSVIEHVRTWENQRKMAAEMRRVAPRYFVQTPNKYFPIEPHYLLPFFQYVPQGLKYWILTRTPLSRMRRWSPEHARQYLDEIRLLTKPEMRALFPDGSLYEEKVLGLTKSYTAYNF